MNTENDKDVAKYLRRQTNERLEKELAFASSAGDQTWLYACEFEADRRSRMSEVH